MSGSKKANPQKGEPMDVDESDASDNEEGGTFIDGIFIPPPVPAYCSSESKGPRLIITHIENENFKSYANQVPLGPFHHKFSAIIGPNGSGKSNVIDAMLFVFGYRAQKIRSKKVSVLLHNSARFPNVKSCKVSVHFVQITDNPDGTYNRIPDTEIVVERVALKDSSSYYLINGRKVHFKEVAKLLKEHGIDLDHNRFLILQGEVESIAMMKPKALTENECGLLEYLEDIIGTTRYKKPLIQLNDRVDTMNVERTEKHNRCKLAEREMQDLQEPMQKAIKFLEMENDFYRGKNLQAQKYIRNYNKLIGEGSEELKKTTEELEEHDKQFGGITKEREEKEAIVEERMKSKESLFKRREQAESDLKKAQKKFDEVQENMKNTNSRRKTLKTSLEKEKAKLEELRKVPEKNAVEIQECETKVAKLTEERDAAQATLEKNMAAFKEETRELQEQKDRLQNKLIGLREQADKDKAELQVMDSKLQMVKHDEVLEIRKLETFKANYAESKKSLEDKKTRVKEAKTEVQELKVRHQECQKTLAANKTEEEQVSGRVKVLRARIDESRQEMQAVQGRGKVLDFLMKQKAEGKIPGIFGRLGDLGAINRTYDVAISTCCGRLDDILVDSVETGQRCIEVLKKHDVGRANFIALEKMETYKSKMGNFRVPNGRNVHRIFDLVKVEDQRVLPALYFALKDTLVVDDLEEATRIAYQGPRYRVVTLGGELIEKSGTMSGGGNQKMRGKMKEKVQTQTKTQNRKSDSRELERWMIEAEEMQHRVNALQQEQGQLETEILSLERQIKAREYEVQKLEQEIRSLTDQLPKIAENLERQEEKARNTQSDAKEVKVLEEQIAKLRKTAEVSNKAASEVQGEVDGINAQIRDIQDKKIKTFKDRVASLSKQLDKLTANVNKLRVEIGASERNVKKSEANIENTTQEISGCEESLRKFNEVREEAQTKQEELQQTLEEIQAEVAKAEEGFGGIKKEIQALQKREHEGKVKRQEIEQRVQTIETQIEDLRKKIPHWDKILQGLKLHDIPNQEPPAPFKVYTDEDLDGRQLSDIAFELEVLEENIQRKPNLSVIAEFKKKREVYLDRVKNLEDITLRRNEMRQKYEDVRKQRFTEFVQGFTIINKKLKEMYQMITLGGDAELELVDSMDPFTEGIVFSVRPPKKSWKQISNLSGGEKTLSSLALVFALHYYKPSPLYVMDEIDAALDFKNVSIVANYIKERTKNAQFIIISLRSNMFELSDHLVGISKCQDCTSSVTIKNFQPMVRGTLSQVPNQTISTQFDLLRSSQEAPLTQPVPDTQPTQEPVEETSAGTVVPETPSETTLMDMSDSFVESSLVTE